MEEKELLAAIGDKCLDCVCGDKKEVEECRCFECPLGTYRNVFFKVKRKKVNINADDKENKKDDRQL